LPVATPNKAQSMSSNGFLTTRSSDVLYLPLFSLPPFYTKSDPIQNHRPRNH
jgi:hypothetical protein